MKNVTADCITGRDLAAIEVYNEGQDKVHSDNEAGPV